MWLMKHRNLSKAAAYDVARREFYQHRHLEDVRRRVAREEALHVGAYFAKGPLEIGMELEDKTWESWKQWAGRQIEEEEAMRAQMFSGPQAEETAMSEADIAASIREEVAAKESAPPQNAAIPIR